MKTRLILFCLILNTYAIAQNVGIGITTPSRLLHVHDSTSTPTILLSSSTTTTLGLKFQINSPGAAFIINDRGGLFLGTNGSSVIKMYSGGTVGINTATTATNQLHVSATLDPLRLEGLQQQNEDTLLVTDADGVIYKRPSSDFDDDHWERDGDNVYNSSDSIGIGTNDPKGNLHVYQNSSQANVYISTGNESDIARLNVESPTNLNDFRFEKYGTAISTTIFGSVSRASMSRIYSGQSSSALIIDQAGFRPILFGTNNLERMRISESGEVGIGTDMPSELLDIAGNVNVEDTLITASFLMPSVDAGIGKVLVSDADGNGQWQTLPIDADWQIVGPNMISGMSGNVGIGISSPPNSKFEINGSVSMSIRLLSPGPAYNMTSQDYTVISGSNAINLPDAAVCPGRIYVLKWTGGAPSTNINPFVGNTIEGLTGSFVAVVPNVIKLQSDGVSGWWIID
ncbi:MAG: hypothetical protein AAGK97_02265 [Bacteroidota bacterium]